MLISYFNLKSPYPLSESISRRILHSIIFSAFVFLFLFVFKPFELGALKSKLLPIALGYGMVCFAIMLFLNVILFKLFPNYFAEHQWNIQRELQWSIINLFLIAFANLAYSNFLHITSLSIPALGRFLSYTIAVGIFPIFVGVILNYARLNRKFDAETTDINPLIESANEIFPILENDNIIITAENGNVELELNAAQFLYAKSSDNYVELYFSNNGQIERKVIRNTLKNIYASLSLHDTFYRCHKSYLINLSQVNHISGNAQGYKFHLKNTNELIPVSRSNNDFVKNYFTNRPKNTQFEPKTV